MKWNWQLRIKTFILYSGLSDLYNNKMASAQLVPDNNNLFDGDAEVGHINQEKEAPIWTVQDKTSSEIIGPMYKLSLAKLPML